MNKQADSCLHQIQTENLHGIQILASKLSRRPEKVEGAFLHLSHSLITSNIPHRWFIQLMCERPGEMMGK